MGRATISWLGVLWGLAAAVISVLFALSIIFGTAAAGMRQRLERRLDTPPLRLRVDLSRRGTYSADWQIPYYGENGTEFELLATLPRRDPSALLLSLNGFQGTVAFSQRSAGAGPLRIAASDFRETSGDALRHNRARGAFLWVELLRAEGTGRLTLTVDQPALALAGREQVLEARPVADPVSAVWPIYFTWALATVSFLAGVVMTAMLILARRRRRAAAPTPS